MYMIYIYIFVLIYSELVFDRLLYWCNVTTINKNKSVDGSKCVSSKSERAPSCTANVSNCARNPVTFCYVMLESKLAQWGEGGMFPWNLSRHFPLLLTDSFYVVLRKLFV